MRNPKHTCKRCFRVTRNPRALSWADDICPACANPEEITYSAHEIYMRDTYDDTVFRLKTVPTDNYWHAMTLRELMNNGV